MHIPSDQYDSFDFSNIADLVNLDNLKNVNLEVPPDHFNFDLSTNISLVLAKNNKLNPSDLAKNIKELLLFIKKMFQKIKYVIH